jgi:hypothetical protein
MELTNTICNLVTGELFLSSINKTEKPGYSGSYILIFK